MSQHRSNCSQPHYLFNDSRNVTLAFCAVAVQYMVPDVRLDRTEFGSAWRCSIEHVYVLPTRGLLQKMLLGVQSQCITYSPSYIYIYVLLLLLFFFS